MYSADMETGRSLLALSQAPPRRSKSKTARVKSTLKAIIHPVRSRQEKKAKKNELKEREESERVANIDNFLACGRIYYEKQLQEQIPYDPFSDSLRHRF